MFIAVLSLRTLFVYVVAVILAQASAVAPGDEDPICDELRASGSIPTPDYDSTMRILMDTWNYKYLLPPQSSAVWKQVDNDNNNPVGATTHVSISNSIIEPSANPFSYSNV